MVIDVSYDLLESAEPVYLLLLDRLKLYPSTISTQVQDIVQQANACNMIAVASVLQESGRLRFGLFRSLLNRVAYTNIGIKVNLSDETPVHVSSSTLFRLQVALRRLAGIVRYASSIEFVDFDDTFHKFKRNYDPDLIDRSKLLAMINILRVQLNTHPDSPEKSLLLGQLDQVEHELKRKKVRWGAVLTAFFVIFGFVADLKTIKPDLYDAPIAIVERIITTMHQDGLVSSKPQELLTEKSETKSDEDSDSESENGEDSDNGRKQDRNAALIAREVKEEEVDENDE